MLCPSLLPSMKEILTDERVRLEPAFAMAAAAEDGMHGKLCENGDLSANRTAEMASSAREGPVILQWGRRKRPRCSRDSHLKHSTITDEPAVSLRKTVRAKAERVAPAEISKAKNGARDRPRQPPPVSELLHVQEGRKRAKILRTGASALIKVCSRASSKEARGPSSSNHTQNVHRRPVSKIRTSPSPNRSTASPHRYTIPMGGSIESEVAKTEMDWPKFFISLSHKEKEDDFLMIKGTKLPQRPKRRPKIVEKSLNFCSPGNWLTDLSHGRYEVREKKSMRKKPRGLKAMESMDSESE